jgi:NADH-quinone oxidoreductase subunit N
MTGSELVALSPLIALSVSIVAVMLVISFYRDPILSSLLTMIGLVLTVILLPAAASSGVTQVTPLIIMDGYALFYIGLLSVTSIAVALLSYNYLLKHNVYQEEFYLLLLLATLGSSVLAASSHFASFFLGLEVLTVSLYAMIAYLRGNSQGIEAGLKYLVLAGASAAFLLFGMALVYAQSGTMEFARMASLRATPDNVGNGLLLAGFAMLVIGIGFKLAFVPFHMWTPDVYEGAPAPVTAFIASVSKGGMFAVLLRYFAQVDVHAFNSLFIAFTVISIASMFFGNLLALLQNNVKRILAYSSIAHFGYILVAFLASGAYAATAVTLYLVAYFATIVTAFGVVSVLSGPEGEMEALEDYQGLSLQRPWLAAVLTIALLSLAGIPLTAGFIGKFFVFRAGVGSALWLLVLVLVAGSAIGLFYYLRVVVAIYSHPAKGEKGLLAAPSIMSAGGIVLAALTLIVVWLGLYPTPLITLIERAMAGLT